MTDYLEELLEDAGVLLEEVKRLERSGAVPLSEEAPRFLPLPGERGNRGRNTREDAAVFAEESRPEGEAAEVQTRRALEERFSSGERPGETGQVDAPKGETARELVPEEPDARETGDVPLLEELARLERAAAVLEGSGLERTQTFLPEQRGERRTDYPLALVRGGGNVPPELEPPERWGGRSWPESAQDSSGGALSLAEQTDQAFRRDSRRYDGGFSLY